MATNVFGRCLLRYMNNRTCNIIASCRYSNKICNQVIQTVRPTRTVTPVSVISSRSIFTSKRCHQEVESEDFDEDASASELKKGILRNVVDVDTSIDYMKSKAFQLTYGDALIWEPYHRNFKGQKPRKLTRKQCIRGGKLATGNPCPLCRDEYLTVHPKNVELLKHFVSPQSGTVITYEKTGVCQQQHEKLLITVQQAWDLGYLEMPISHRWYDYADYYPEIKRRSFRHS